MKLHLMMLFIGALNGLPAQPATISVLGRHTYTHHPSQFIFALPNASTMYGQETLTAFFDTLFNAHISYQTDTTYVLYDGEKIWDRIELSTQTASSLELIRSLAKHSGIDGKYYYRFRDTGGTHQDSLALKAFEDAQRRAEAIAGHLEGKLGRVVNIDDQVEKYLFYSEKIVIPRCRETLNKAIKLLDQLSEDPSGYSSENIKSGQYALWVTFELK